MISRQDLAELLSADRTGPCLSIYQPMERRFPEQQQNIVRYRNLLRELENAERRGNIEAPSEKLLAPMRALADDVDLWSHPTDGLAVFSAAGFFRAHRLPRTVPELAIAADTFHIKPLLRMVQSADRYQVLVLNRERLRLLEGNRDALEEVDLADGVPSTIEEALGEQLTELHTHAFSYGTGPAGGAGGRRNMTAGAKVGGIHHGQGSRKDEIDLDIERFFRTVDRAILDHHSKPSGLPLVLAALPEYHAPFHRLSHNRQLLEHGIEINADALTNDELRERAWQCMQPVYLQRLQLLIDRYGAARAAGRADETLPQVALAAAVGRVDVMLLEGDRRLAGSMDPASGVFAMADAGEAVAAGDIYDDLAEAVLRNGGEVIIVPVERMPTTTGIAAIYRY
jgi:hypothetical protein